ASTQVTRPGDPILSVCGVMNVDPDRIRTLWWLTVGDVLARADSSGRSQEGLMPSPVDDLPDPGPARTLDDLADGLRRLKVWAGDPSYESLKDRVNAAWVEAGRPA